MKPPSHARRLWLAAALGASLAMTAWTWRRQHDTPVNEPAPRPASSQPLSPGGPPPVVAQVDARAAVAPDAVADPFAMTQWEPAAPPAPPPPPPPPEPVPAPPQAPPLPFRYLGRQQPVAGPASATEYYLARDDAVFVVRVGERIGDDYRFDGVDSQGGLAFVYLPLASTLTLSLGEEQ